MEILCDALGKNSIFLFFGPWRYQWMSKLCPPCCRSQAESFPEGKLSSGKRFLCLRTLQGRLQAWMRTRAARKVSSNSLLAEFLWAASCPQRSRSILLLICCKRCCFGKSTTRNRKKHDPSLKDSKPEPIVQDTSSTSTARTCGTTASNCS